MKRFYKVFLLSLLLVYLCQVIAYAKVLDYSEITSKSISTSRTSSSNSFPSFIDYSDSEGYSGNYYKYGSSYVISGEAPKYKEVTVTRSGSSLSFPSYYYYDDGEYSGFISLNGGASSYTVSKNVSVSIISGEVQGYICSKGGTAVPNPNYDESKFNYSDITTWAYWESGTVWGKKVQFDSATNDPSNCTVSWNGLTPVSAYYDDGDYSGSLSVSYSKTDHQSFARYSLNPGNGYTPPFTGQHSQTDYYTYVYNGSGTVYGTRYTQKYTGYVSTDDTRVWKQDYSGTAYKKIEKTLDAVVTTDIPDYLEENKSIDITVTAKNTGTLSWSKGDIIKLNNLGSDVNIDEKFEIPDGTIVKPGGAVSWKITLPPLSEGSYNFNFSMIKDNGDGNFGNEYSKTMKVYSLKPENGSLNVIKYDYNKGNNYYIRPGSTAEIVVDGYFESYTGKYPTNNYVKYEDADSGDILEQKTGSSGTSFSINEISKNIFNKVNNSTLIKSSKDNKNIVTNSQQVVITGDDVIYKLYNKTSYEDSNTNYGIYSNSNKNLIVDGTAPKVDDRGIDVSSDSNNIFTNITQIIEKGSGVKEVTISYSNGVSTKTEIISPSEDGTYESVKKITDLNFGSNLEKVHVTITAEDNVGNKGTIFDEDVYLIKIEAEIVRILEPHDPIFKGGEKGVLNIKLYGGMDKYKIYFPSELLCLDSTLNKEESISPQKVTEINYEFFIPLGSKNGAYSVTVEGFKGDKKKSVQPNFQVKDSITDQLRTRIRLPERN